MNKKFINRILLSISLITVLPIIAFTINFWNQNISQDIAKWGALGDYFGGILNTFFSFLTLIVTIYITYILSNIEENRNKENLNFDKEKLLREFRENEYKRINSELHKIWIGMTESNNQTAQSIIYNCVIQYRYFITSNGDLFNFLADKEILDLQKSLDNIHKLVLGNEEQLDKSSVLEELVKNYDAFNNKFQIFLLRV